MKGVVLAGGLGTRLRPLTLITNKHLLPVYDRPMILYTLETLKQSGITDIMIVCGKEYAGHFISYLGSGKRYGIKLSFALQENDSGGIADALSYCEDFANKDSCAVILGDNIFDHTFEESVTNFTTGAQVFFKKVPDPERFGVPVFDKKGKKLQKIEEKPTHPKSAYALTGLYLVDDSVFERIRTLKPSGRGELEMTDLINLYLDEGELDFGFVKGGWHDAGTIDSLFDASVWVRQMKRGSTSNE